MTAERRGDLLSASWPLVSAMPEETGEEGGGSSLQAGRSAAERSPFRAASARAPRLTCLSSLVSRLSGLARRVSRVARSREVRKGRRRERRLSAPPPGSNPETADRTSNAAQTSAEGNAQPRGRNESTGSRRPGSSQVAMFRRRSSWVVTGRHRNESTGRSRGREDVRRRVDDESQA